MRLALVGFALALVACDDASETPIVHAGDAGFEYVLGAPATPVGALEPSTDDAGALVVGARGSLGAVDGTSSNARFCTVRASAWDGSFAYVADSCVTGLRRVDLATGEVETIAFATPLRQVGGLATDGSGTVFVSDTLRSVIYAARPSDRTLTLLTGKLDVRDDTDGALDAATFDSPRGLAFDRGSLLVADTGNHAVRRIDLGARRVSTLATGFVGVWALAPRGDGVVYVTDALADSVMTITSDGSVSTLAGFGRLGTNGYLDAVGTKARFADPRGIVFDAASSAVYVADFGNLVVRRIDPASGKVTTFAGADGRLDFQDGTGHSAHFRGPMSLALVAPGRILVGDDGAVRILDASRAVHTVSGLPPRSGVFDGHGAEGRFDVPTGMAWISPTRVVVADCGNSALRVVDVPGRALSTLAGQPGESGFWDDMGRDARFECPAAVAYDGGRWLFVADSDNRAIRAVSLDTREVRSLAGTPSRCGSVDGAFEQATFCNPVGVAFLPPQWLFVADASTHTIRRLDLIAHQVSTVAGVPWRPGNADGVGKAALLHAPRSLTAHDGALFIADSENRAIRRFDPATGAVTTVHSAPLDLPRDVSTLGGELLVVDRSHVWALDPSTGALRAELETSAISRRSQFAQPSAALATVGDELLVLDRGENALLRTHVAR